MNPKEQLIQELDNLPNSVLIEALDFVHFLKQKYSLKNNKMNSGEIQSESTPLEKKSFLKYAGKWEGDDGEKCLKQIYNSRGLVEF